MLQNQEPLLTLPLNNETTQHVTLRVNTNFIGEVHVPFEIKLQGRFLNLPEGFNTPCKPVGASETDQKLSRDPLTGRLYLCSTVTKEQLAYELNACSFDSLHYQLHI
jgi:hypothetical protein